jgi:hypothetical protein
MKRLGAILTIIVPSYYRTKLLALTMLVRSLVVKTAHHIPLNRLAAIGRKGMRIKKEKSAG